MGKFTGVENAALEQARRNFGYRMSQRSIARLIYTDAGYPHSIAYPLRFRSAASIYSAIRRLDKKSTT